MRIMKVILTVRDGAGQIEVEANPHGISVKDGECRVVVPMFDHWTNTESYSFRGIDVRSKIKGDNLAIEFPDESSRSRFHDWLNTAFDHATQGYKTMWP